MNNPAYDALMKVYPLTLEDLPGEVWLPIPDWEDYHGSNFGRVKSFKQNKQRILKPEISKGYLRVTLTKGNKKKRFLVHRLVALCFIPNPEGKPTINHKDGNKLNNHVENLEWATIAENNQHAYDIGLKILPQGEDRYNSKLTNQQARLIRENPEGLTQDKLAEMFGVTPAVISNIQLGKVYKKAGGSVRDKIKERVTEEIKTQIRAEYQKGVHGFGTCVLAKKYGVNPTTILRIVNS